MKDSKFYLYVKISMGVLIITAIFVFSYNKFLTARQYGLDESEKDSFFPRMTLEDNFVRSAFNYVQENILGGEKGKDEKRAKENAYFLHKNITATIFWIGEKASDANNDISNSPSAWDEKWKSHFGGTDSPKDRNEFFPAKFTPKENPFYVALPYNDFDSKGKRKREVFSIIPWAREKEWKDDESLCKNRWVKIIKNAKTAYAQWEDVGPYKENDAKYVFGKSKPKNKINESAGIDVSPAVRDYLDIKDIDRVDWQFVDESSVPEGPWIEIITRSNIYWK